MIFLKNYFANTTAEIDFISVVHDVRYAVRDSGAKDGLVTVFVPGSGAAVAIIEPIHEVIEEIKAALEVFAGETEKAADKKKEQVDIAPRVQAAFLGRHVSIPLKGGHLMLDPYEDVFLIDLDKKIKRREFYVQVMAEAEGAAAAAAPQAAKQQKRR